MNNIFKYLSLAILVLLLLVVWGFVLLGERAAREDSAEGGAVEQQLEDELTADIPEEMADVAEEEYAIEFEAANEPLPEINEEFCGFVKEQCDNQGVKNCEDYKTCMEGIKQ